MQFHGAKWKLSTITFTWFNVSVWQEHSLKRRIRIRVFWNNLKTTKNVSFDKKYFTPLGSNNLFHDTQHRKNTFIQISRFENKNPLVLQIPIPDPVIPYIPLTTPNPFENSTNKIAEKTNTHTANMSQYPLAHLGVPQARPARAARHNAVARQLRDFRRICTPAARKVRASSVPREPIAPRNYCTFACAHSFLLYTRAEPPMCFHAWLEATYAAA